jgi:hypothetical protein
MKLLKITLLVAALIFALTTLGCQAQARRDVIKRQIYSQRADGLRIPTYSYAR